MKEVFDKIYKTNAWQGKSVSGPGSDIDHTESIRKNLPTLIRKYNITRMVDCACGDFGWMSQVLENFSKEELFYVGIDIVKDLIENNRCKYGGTTFIEADFITTPIVGWHLIVSRDVMNHLSLESIQKALKNLKDNKYILLTHFQNNRPFKDTKDGGWRTINWTLPPFNFPPPIETISENYYDPAYSDKCMGLWQL